MKFKVIVNLYPVSSLSLSQLSWVLDLVLVVLQSLAVPIILITNK